MHLKFLESDENGRLDIVYDNLDYETIVNFALDNDYIDEDGITWIRKQLQGDRNDYPAALMSFDADLMQRDSYEEMCQSEDEEYLDDIGFTGNEEFARGGIYIIVYIFLLN